MTQKITSEPAPARIFGGGAHAVSITLPTSAVSVAPRNLIFNTGVVLLFGPGHAG